MSDKEKEEFSKYCTTTIDGEVFPSVNIIDLNKALEWIEIKKTEWELAIELKHKMQELIFK